MYKYDWKERSKKTSLLIEYILLELWIKIESLIVTAPLGIQLQEKIQNNTIN